MDNPSPSLSHLLDQAVAGDPQAIQNVLLYLNSTNPDLRHMMQTALHAAHNDGLWRRLLHCVAHDCWPQPEALAPQASKGGARGEQKTPPPAGRSFTSARLPQSIIEAFVVDSSFDPESEMEVKQGVLLPALDDADQLIRWAAGYLLGLRGSLHAIPALEEILSTPPQASGALTPDQRVRWQLRAVQSLEVLNDDACGAPLITALASPERTVHHAAGQAITELGRKAEPALLHALHHDNPHVRWHAARALGQIGDLRALGPLTEGLYDDNQEVRWTTARVLANLDAPAIPAILQVLCTQPINEPLRQSAYHALNSMACLRQPEIHAYLAPIMDVLRQQNAISIISLDAPMIAQRMLAGWTNIAALYSEPPGRDQRHIY